MIVIMYQPEVCALNFQFSLWKKFSWYQDNVKTDIEKKTLAAGPPHSASLLEAIEKVLLVSKAASDDESNF